MKIDYRRPPEGYKTRRIVGARFQWLKRLAAERGRITRHDVARRFRRRYRCPVALRRYTQSLLYQATRWGHLRVIERATIGRNARPATYGAT